MAGGGTGGHVIPALAVARELQRRGHEPFFVGTTAGIEAKLVPAAGFPIHWIRIGGLKRVGLTRRLRTLGQLPLGTLEMLGALGRWRPAAVFSMGGYVAGPVVIAGRSAAHSHGFDGTQRGARNDQPLDGAGGGPRPAQFRRDGPLFP